MFYTTVSTPSKCSQESILMVTKEGELKRPSLEKYSVWQMCFVLGYYLTWLIKTCSAIMNSNTTKMHIVRVQGDFLQADNLSLFAPIISSRRTLTAPFSLNKDHPVVCCIASNGQKWEEQKN